MRGFGFAEHGGVEQLRWVEIAEPSPGAGEVRVRVRAAGLNRLDRFVLEGIPGVTIERPHVMGSDASGEVDRCGADVRDLAVGARVLVNPGLWDGTCEACRAGSESLCRAFRIVGEHTQGTMTRYLVVPRRNVHPLPDRLSFEEAAAAPLVFQTAWRALRTVGAVAPHETVAIIGAGGGVSTAAIQIAKLAGARVLAVSRSDAKLERARTLGADETLVLEDSRPIDRALWQWSGKRGVDVILDSVGAQTVGQTIRALARGGRLVVIGATTGPNVQIDLRTVFWRQTSLRGSTMASRGEFEAMLRHLTDGSLRPVVDSVYSWDRSREAFERFGGPDLFGKVVVRIE